VNKKPYVGGMAVIEGVFMKSPQKAAVAIRREDKTIDVKTFYSSVPRGFMAAPFIRGVVALYLTMVEGIKILRPQGAFYLFVDISDFGMSSEEMSNYLLEKYGVSSLPGANFGPGGEGYLRFSYATSIENINEGIKRLKEAFASLR
jgi:aspartate/methionine/tyrosine aminotransferase